MEKKRVENEAYCHCTSERPFLRTMLCLILNCFTSGHADGITLIGAGGTVRTRYMKGNMNEADFKAWAVKAMVDRDTAIEQITPTIAAVLRT